MDIAAIAYNFRRNFEGVYVDEDGWYGSQCWDLANRYGKEYGCPTLRTGNGYAYGVFLNYAAGPQAQYFDLVVNDTNDPNQTAPDGAIIIWNDRFYYPAGHIAVKVGGGASSTMLLLEQDGSKDYDGNGTADAPAYVTNRGYANVAGWLVPKGVNMSKTDINIARILTFGILGRNAADGTGHAINGAYDDDLNRYHVGVETNAEIWNLWNSDEGKNWVHNRLPALINRANLTAVAEGQLRDANLTIQGLRNQVAALGSRPTPEQLADLQKKLDDAVQRATDAQVQMEQLKAEKAEADKTGSAFMRWIGELINRISGVKQ